VHGGHIVASGWLDKLLTAKKNETDSVTLAYLRGEKKIEIPDERRTQDKGKIMIRNGNVFNIKNMDVDVPLGRLITITGVSGSGKSTFMYELIHKNLQARLIDVIVQMKFSMPQVLLALNILAGQFSLINLPLVERLDQIQRHTRGLDIYSRYVCYKCRGSSPRLES
jgi:excinuclease UvrABC ATPase subunit